MKRLNNKNVSGNYIKCLLIIFQFYGQLQEHERVLQIHTVEKRLSIFGLRRENGASDGSYGS